MQAITIVLICLISVVFAIPDITINFASSIATGALTLASSSSTTSSLTGSITATWSGSACNSDLNAINLSVFDSSLIYSDDQISVGSDLLITSSTKVSLTSSDKTVYNIPASTTLPYTSNLLDVKSIHMARMYVLTCDAGSKSRIIGIAYPSMITKFTINSQEVSIQTTHKFDSTEIVPTSASALTAALGSKAGINGLSYALVYEKTHLESGGSFVPYTWEETATSYARGDIVSSDNIATFSAGTATVQSDSSYYVFNRKSSKNMIGRYLVLYIKSGSTTETVGIAVLGNNAAAGTYTSIRSDASGKIFRFSTPSYVAFVFQDVPFTATTSSSFEIKQYSVTRMAATLASKDGLGESLTDFFATETFTGTSKTISGVTTFDFTFCISGDATVLSARTLLFTLAGASTTYTGIQFDGSQIAASSYSYKTATVLSTESTDVSKVTAFQFLSTESTDVSKVTAFQFLIEPPTASRSEVRVFAKINILPTFLEDVSMNYHIHVGRTGGARCAGPVGGHLDPTFKGMSSLEEVGNLSGRHGPLTRASPIAIYEDSYIVFGDDEKNNIRGRSVVLHDALASGARVMCGNVLDASTDVSDLVNSVGSFAAVGTTSGATIEFFRRTPDAYSYLSFNGNNLNYNYHLSPYSLNSTACPLYAFHTETLSGDAANFFPTADSNVATNLVFTMDGSTDKFIGRSIVVTRNEEFPKPSTELIPLPFCIQIGTALPEYLPNEDVLADTIVYNTIVYFSGKIVRTNEQLNSLKTLIDNQLSSLSNFKVNLHKVRIVSQEHTYNDDGSTSFIVNVRGAIPDGSVNAAKDLINNLVTGGSIRFDALSTDVISHTCADGIVNNGETDVDCGSHDCGACPNGSACTSNDACLSLKCLNMICVERDNSAGTFTVSAVVVVIAMLASMITF